MKLCMLTICTEQDAKQQKTTVPPATDILRTCAEIEIMPVIAA